jgi:hypothetical protein
MTDREALRKHIEKLSREAFTAWFEGNYRQAEALWAKQQDLKEQLANCPAPDPKKG